MGDLGYVNSARELAEQAADVGLEIYALVHATDRASKQAGLLVGLAGSFKVIFNYWASACARRKSNWFPTWCTVPRSILAQASKSPVQMCM